MEVFFNSFSLITQFMTFESYPLSHWLGGYFHFGNDHFLFLNNRIFLSSCLFIQKSLELKIIL